MHEDSPNGSVLILHAGSLGDCVLTIQLAQAMKQAWNHPSVVLVARSRIARWALRRGLLSHAYSFEQLKDLRLYDPGPELSESTARFLADYGLIVSFLGGPDDPISARLRTSPGLTVVTLDPRPRQTSSSDRVHITQQWADQLSECGYHLPAPIGVQVDLPPAERDNLRRRLRARLGISSRRISLFHPGSGGPAKCCPLSVLQHLMRAMMQRDWGVGWMIGPDEMERWGITFRRRLENTAALIYEDSVEAATDLVCGAELYVGNDAGMTHAAALVVPTIAIFGPTDPQVWRPLSDSCRVAGFPDTSSSIDYWTERVLASIDASCFPAPDT